MSDFDDALADPRIAARIEAIRKTVLEHYPGTTFTLSPGEGPGTVWLWAAVDVDDTDEVWELVADQTVDFVVDGRSPLLFIPVWTTKRSEAYWHQREAERRALAPTGTAP